MEKHKLSAENLKEKLASLWATKKPIVILVIVVVLLALVGGIVAIAMNGDDNEEVQNVAMVDTDGDGVADAPDSDGDGIADSEDPDGNKNAEGLPMVDTNGDGIPDSVDSDGDGTADIYEEDSSEDASEDDGSKEDESETDSTLEDIDGDGLPDLAEGTYEQWLAAGMVTGISMYYFDKEFDIKAIYVASETVLNKSEESKGAYVVFTVDGTEKVMKSLPLEDERTDKGTVDLYARNFGFATFEETDMTEAQLSEMEKVELKDLEVYISQLYLPTVYEH